MANEVHIGSNGFSWEIQGILVLANGRCQKDRSECLSQHNAKCESPQNDVPIGSKNLLDIIL